MTDELERLIEAVERGQKDLGTLPEILKPDAGLAYLMVYKAQGNDDMNAALSLLAALLPDHTWGRAPGGQMWVQRPPTAPVWSGDDHPPARGLLLAILRAYAGERVNETADR